MKPRRWALFFWLSAVLALGWAQVAPAASAVEWVGPATTTTPRPNTWLSFRRSYALTDQPARATARIAVDSKYWLWINGTLVVREGGLKRGPTPTGTYVDTVDLTPHLRVGDNTVAVLVWYFGKHGFSHRDSGRPGLWFDADLDGQSWTSDAPWRVRQHPAFGDSAPPHPNYRLAEANIRFDARLDEPTWTQPGFADATWPVAASHGPPPTAPWGELTPRPIPLWRDHGRRDYPTIMPANDGVIRARLPYNAQVHPWFKIIAPAGLLIDVRTDNYRGGGAPNVRAEYVTREGEQEFECPGWMNGHEVHYRFPAGVRVLALGYRETSYDVEPVGSFSSDDPALNQLWREAARTLSVTMRDTYMDCPDRERAQWWGDVVLQLGEAFYALDRRADALARKGMLELAAWQRPDGSLFSPVPAGNWDQELPTQMLASVGHYGFWTYYLHSGDADTLRRVYPAVKRYLDLWPLGADGLAVVRPGGWSWGDWGENVDLPVLTNAWYFLALKAQRAMASLVGQPDDLPAIDARLASITRHFHATYWTGTAFRSPDHAGATDDRAQGLAVVAGLARPENYPALRTTLRTQHHASPYLEKYILEALLQMGATDEALARMKERYAPMLTDDLTTLYEGWGVGAAGFGGGTYNHAWSGGPLTLLSQYVAGVTPLTPGYTTYQVRPQLGPLTRVTARAPSVRGVIDVITERTGASYRVTLDSPADTQAVVVLPFALTDSRATVRVNQQTVWPRAHASAAPAGVSAVAADHGEVRLTLDPGRWVIEVNPPAGETPPS
jgi:alpha-L-rhamnosidase